jgi:hypothetical protein
MAAASSSFLLPPSEKRSPADGSDQPDKVHSTIDRGIKATIYE